MKTIIQVRNLVQVSEVIQLVEAQRDSKQLEAFSRVMHLCMVFGVDGSIKSILNRIFGDKPQ